MELEGRDADYWTVLFMELDDLESVLAAKDKVVIEFIPIIINARSLRRLILKVV